MVSLAASIHGVEERRPVGAPVRRIPYWAMVAALLLHIAIVIICIIDWSALFALALARPEPPDAIPVALVYAPPPPPPAPPPQPPKPVVQPEPPQPQPAPPVTPRMSGTEDKTEAKLDDLRQPALPQPKAPPVPAPETKKASVTPTGQKDPASANPETRATERQTAVIPEPRKEVPPGELFHSIRLPSQHGGTGAHDTAGDAYLNRMRDLVESHRIYPPASAFSGGAERLAVYSILVDPSGDLVQITMLASSGSSVADEAAGHMIRSSAPFPPLPPNYPHIRTLITVELPIYPNPR